MARTATPDATAQFEIRGYVLSENAEAALSDVAGGLMALSLLCEERQDDMPEIAPAQWGGLLRVFSRQVQAVTDEAPFANKALARKRGR